ncbi:MAG: rRNA small subunit methyltransferase I [uncultured Sulfurovum sp.]|uniref:Ribosomal RNA small subunit methyltransferase I n=1 Tax=uncultured Sulfurovum sp. TaxID=269237 RepID=A0A6S6RT20_9BACT|nr:MAG: rRNA small subunit methyltransferase I [uncultured Sulfurovum sp.]
MLTFIPTPIGNPQDITIRALKEFEKASLFLCEDTRETKRLLRILEERFDFAYPSDEVEFLSFHEHNGAERLGEVASRLADEAVVYVSDAGMPVISDPGQLLVEHCQEHKISYDVLPGGTAVTTAYAASGFKEGEFTFSAFLPQKGSERSSSLIEMMNRSINVVLYEAPHRIEKLITEIAHIDEEREVFFSKELSKKFQNYYRGSAKEILEQFESGSINNRGEWVVVIAAKKEKVNALYVDDILAFDLQPKVKAKLLAKLTDKSVKEWYNELIDL